MLVCIVVFVYTLHTKILNKKLCFAYVASWHWFFIITVVQFIINDNKRQ